MDSAPVHVRLYAGGPLVPATLMMLGTWPRIVYREHGGEYTAGPTRIVAVYVDQRCPRSLFTLAVDAGYYCLGRPGPESDEVQLDDNDLELDDIDQAATPPASDLDILLEDDALIP